MRIIKRGEIVALKPVKRTCSKCKTVFEYVKNDVESDQRDGNYVKCPVCKSFIAVK